MEKNAIKRVLLILSAAALLTACSPRTADVADAPFTYADTIAWDGEYDVVVIGFGNAGAVAAKYAAEEGASVLVTEKAPEGEEGGNSRVCGQFFMSTDDYETLLTHYQAKAGEKKSVSDTMLKTYVKGISDIVDQLVNDFGAVREKMYSWHDTGIPMFMSEYPELPGAEAVRIRSLSINDVGNGGLYRLLSAPARNEETIDVWFESPAVDLIQDPDTKTIIGVVIEREGRELKIRADNGVVMALGGFENNPELVENYIGLTDYSVNGTLYNTGDGIPMAIRAGARLWHMEVYEGSMGPFGNIAFEGVRGWTPTHDFADGSIIYVGENGKRFLREDESARHGHVSLGGVWVTPKRPEKAYLVFDQSKYESIMAMESIASRANIPPAIVDEKAVSGRTLAELCEKTGIDYEGLRNEIDNFSSFARSGNDLKLERSPSSMEPFDRNGPYYAIRVVPNMLNTQGGPERNENAEILDTYGNPIPHLYSAGEFGGISNNMYTAGGNVAECIIFGRIAGLNAAAPKEALPAYTAPARVESNMVYVPGYATDISSYSFETEENEYLGTGQGIGGDLVIKAEITEGTIRSVEIMREKETDGIGTAALEKMPSLFVGLSSEDDIYGVDIVSGATVTSKALKAAAIDALHNSGN